MLNNLSSRPRLYLHLGTHKTGTTALQAFSVANRDRLKSLGLYYPNFSPFTPGPKDGHHALAHAFSDEPTQLSQTQAESLIGQWHAEACETGLTVIISAEAIYRHVLGNGNFLEKRRRYLEKLNTALADFEVIPVLVFRRPDDYLRSLYQENVAKSSPPRRMPTFADYISHPPPGIHYTSNANVVERVFGSIRVLIYEDLLGALGESFYAALGIDLSDCVSTQHVRPSLSSEETVIKNVINQHLSTRDESDKLIELLRTPLIQKAVRNAYPDPPYDLWPDLTSRQTFLDSRADDVAQLRMRYFPERACLFDEWESKTMGRPVPEPPQVLLEQIRTHLPSILNPTDPKRILIPIYWFRSAIKKLWRTLH
ncbi:MAG: hypothetical protein VBE63_22230 [Lamprobacter sp.]|uniref:hypothetical protein n=1 Tax=Lamprobacter sp. TaxID=3100796 RepID=UPI002B25C4F2|nr:hypothetical protein [Lamprobacter sp.]MEA3642636.1 hypothetical protein [Lamprobacter sp.]